MFTENKMRVYSFSGYMKPNTISYLITTFVQQRLLRVNEICKLCFLMHTLVLTL